MLFRSRYIIISILFNYNYEKKGNFHSMQLYTVDFEYVLLIIIIMKHT